jgi:hypothetical protein
VSLLSFLASHPDERRDLGNADASTCPNGIPGGAEVDIVTIIQAVNHALESCGGG